MIKAVIFDVDGVLINSLKANFKFFGDLMSKFGYGFMKIEEYSLLFHAPMKDIIKYSTKLEDEKEIERIWLSGKNKEVSYPNEFLGTPEKLEEIIQSLSENYTLGIVTGRSRNSIYSIPHLSKLKYFFKFNVAYEDTEQHKPHPAPLLLIVEKLKVLPEECVYIGDSEIDIIAAKAAGMKSINFQMKKLKILF